MVPELLLPHGSEAHLPQGQILDQSRASVTLISHFSKKTNLKWIQDLNIITRPGKLLDLYISE